MRLEAYFAGRDAAQICHWNRTLYGSLLECWQSRLNLWHWMRTCVCVCVSYRHYFCNNYAFAQNAVHTMSTMIQWVKALPHTVCLDRLLTLISINIRLIYMQMDFFPVTLFLSFPLSNSISIVGSASSIATPSAMLTCHRPFWVGAKWAFNKYKRSLVPTPNHQVHNYFRRASNE